MIVRCVSSLFMTEHPTWVAEWAWGLLLIVLTVLIHTSGLWMVRQMALRAHTNMQDSDDSHIHVRDRIVDEVRLEPIPIDVAVYFIIVAAQGGRPA